MSYQHRLPEMPIVIFGFLANFVWEMLQIPWFAGMAAATHGTVVWLCTRATGGDVLILLTGFWLASLVAGDRQWLVRLPRWPVAIFISTGIVVTLILEWLATGPMARWYYADSMPIVPLVNIGAAPLVQWVVLPPAVIALARRHIAGAVVLAQSTWRPPSK